MTYLSTTVRLGPMTTTTAPPSITELTDALVALVAAEAAVFDAEDAHETSARRVSTLTYALRESGTTIPVIVAAAKKARLSPYSKGTLAVYELMGRLLSLPGDLPPSWYVRHYGSGGRATPAGTTSLYTVTSAVLDAYGTADTKTAIDTALNQTGAAYALKERAIEITRTTATGEDELRLVMRHLTRAAEPSRPAGNPAAVLDLRAEIATVVATW